ncbi:hypothetical protein TWF281_000562 [Arthrobotrys megalospora]
MLCACPNLESLKVSQDNYETAPFVSDTLRIIASVIRCNGKLKELGLGWKIHRLRREAHSITLDPLPIIAKLDRLSVNFPLPEVNALNKILEALGPAADTITRCEFTFNRIRRPPHGYRCRMRLVKALEFPSLRHLVMNGELWKCALSPLDIVRFAPCVVRDLTLGFSETVLVDEHQEQLLESIATQFPEVEYFHVGFRCFGRDIDGLLEMHEAALQRLATNLPKIRAMTVDGQIHSSVYETESARDHQIFDPRQYIVERNSETVEVRRVETL